MANKQDLKDALSVEELSKQMGLTKIKNHEWTIQKTSGVEGTGLKESFDWLVKSLQK